MDGTSSTLPFYDSLGHNARTIVSNVDYLQSSTISRL